MFSSQTFQLFSKLLFPSLSFLPSLRCFFFLTVCLFPPRCFECACVISVSLPHTHTHPRARTCTSPLLPQRHVTQPNGGQSLSGLLASANICLRRLGQSARRLVQERVGSCCCCEFLTSACVKRKCWLSCQGRVPD